MSNEKNEKESSLDRFHDKFKEEPIIFGRQGNEPLIDGIPMSLYFKIEEKKKEKKNENK